MNEALIADPVRSKQILERIPAGRWGTPEDFEGAIVYLASRASDYVSGECLVVDGGWMGSESILRSDTRHVRCRTLTHTQDNLLLPVTFRTLHVASSILCKRSICMHPRVPLPQLRYMVGT